MRAILFIAFTIILIPSPVKAQEGHQAFIKYFNECIDIYNSPIGNEVKNRIFQDSINETNYYMVKILDKSPLRFKVQLQAYDYSPIIVGWLDKECIAVHPKILYDNKGCYIWLYETPNTNPTPFILNEKFNDVFTVIDYEDKWLKVMFIINEHLYIAWIKDYCPIVYNSCS